MERNDICKQFHSASIYRKHNGRLDDVSNISSCCYSSRWLHYRRPTKKQGALKGRLVFAGKQAIWEPLH